MVIKLISRARQSGPGIGENAELLVSFNTVFHYVCMSLQTGDTDWDTGVFACWIGVFFFILAIPRSLHDLTSLTWAPAVALPVPSPND